MPMLFLTKGRKTWNFEDFGPSERNPPKRKPFP